MKDLELSRGFQAPNKEYNYLRVGENAIVSSSRLEDAVLFNEIVPELRSREFPVYPAKSIPRKTIFSTPFGIDAATQELKARGFTEGDAFNQSWTGGTKESDLRE